MGVRVGLKSRGDEIHCGLEVTFFSLPVMRPIRRKSRFAIIDSNEPKEVFEAAALGEQCAFHVEENVPGLRTRQAGETLARNERECLEIVSSAVALGDLQRRLMLEAAEGVGLNAWDSWHV